jgi:hypothetical protein
MSKVQMTYTTTVTVTLPLSEVNDLKSKILAADPNAQFSMKAIAVSNGDFVAGNSYRCIETNPKAKPGSDGQPRFTVGNVYLCIKNDSSVAETNGRPPTFLVDNGFASVNCGPDAKLKSKFVLV